MVVRADRPSKDRFGPMAYTLAALGAIQDTPETQYRIEMANETVEVSGISCLIANSGSMGMRGITLSPHINISDGVLDIVVVRYVDLATLAALVAGADPLTNEAFPALQHWQAQEITLDAQPEQTVAIDGEPFRATPCHASAIPGAVNVIIPTGPPRLEGTGAWVGNKQPACHLSLCRTLHGPGHRDRLADRSLNVYVACSRPDGQLTRLHPLRGTHTHQV
jgi:diacylglycerol kinase family enzyme